MWGPCLKIIKNQKRGQDTGIKCHTTFRKCRCLFDGTDLTLMESPLLSPHTPSSSTWYCLVILILEGRKLKLTLVRGRTFSGSETAVCSRLCSDTPLPQDLVVVISPPALGVSVTLWTSSLPWAIPAPQTSVKHRLCWTRPLFRSFHLFQYHPPQKVFQLHWDLESPILPFPSSFHLSYTHPTPTHHTPSLPLTGF